MLLQLQLQLLTIICSLSHPPCNRTVGINTEKTDLRRIVNVLFLWNSSTDPSRFYFQLPYCFFCVVDFRAANKPDVPAP